MTETNVTQRELVSTYFKTTVPRWEEIYRDQRSVYSVIYQARMTLALALAGSLGLAPGAKCLDVGCGPGLGSVGLAKLGHSVTAIDFVDAQLARTRQNAIDAGVGDRVVTKVGDVYKLDFADASFDLVFVIGVMEWMDNPVGPLRELARVLKPGGFAIFSVDNKWALRNLVNPFATPVLAPARRAVRAVLERTGLRSRKAPRAEDHAYSIRAFDSLVAAAGLAKVKGATVGFGPFAIIDRSKPLGLALHYRLQSLADRDLPLLKSGGLVYVAAASKAPGR